MPDDIRGEEETSEEKTKFLFIFKRAPHGTIYPYEGLEVILIMAAYDQDITAAFVDDGVYCLKKGQDTTGLGIKEFAKTFKVLEPYGVEHLYVDRASLEARGLTEEDLVTGVEVVEAEEIANVISAQKVILPF
ncbi:MAG: sulfurtransferase complex subunit TusC [Nitrospinae bacterium]|nr:sulfurtransferase complex subunit TusC [Nitrospinota bacterium]